ncbi:Uncharacterised protein [Vibrio cholerae]|nr:Uncharacterised protein [Vibrio cholerae]
MDTIITRHFLSDLVRFHQTSFCQSSHFRFQLSVLGWCNPFPCWCCHFRCEFIDCFDHGLLLIMTKHNGSQHLFFSQNLCF